jgi:diacylglycerol kinase family enzyme
VTWQQWLAIGIGAFGCLALVGAVFVWRQALRVERAREHAIESAAPLQTPPVTKGGFPSRARHPRQIAVVVNPTKEATVELVETVKTLCSDAGLPEPFIFETTAEDTGRGQAHAAIEKGADVVCAAGGDGTVRAVASGMIGTGVPMGLLPVGTANIFARNLDLPLTSVEESMAIVLGGRTRNVDVGWARVIEAAPVHPLDGAIRRATEGDTQPFLVVTGLGFDATMVAEADESLKKHVGWLAYFMAGARHIHDKRVPATIWLDDDEPVTTNLKSIMVGNCGIIPGGIRLLPEATLDDGELDVALVDARAGMVGWTQVLGEVVLQRAGIKSGGGRLGRIEHARTRRTRIRVEAGELAQVDGEHLGQVVELECWVQPGALTVRSI